jgi:selenide,water dikinase
VGLGAVDDAAVQRLGDGRVLVFTVDVFPPVVDRAEDYGAIAAVNAMSDVWAMGADPALALDIAVFPKDLPPGVAQGILLGAAERVHAAGAVLVGGHTMEASDPIFGLAVVGYGVENELMTKGGLRPGDRLVLTKPLGSGLLTTAAKGGLIPPEALASAIAVMRRLNGPASRAARRHGVRGATDITGFGLIGHATEMAEASNVELVIQYARLPFLAEVPDCAALGVFAGGAHRNRSHFASRASLDPALGETDVLLTCDPQTSGGLLLGCPADRVDGLLEALRTTDPEATCVGEVRAGRGLTLTAG